MGAEWVPKTWKIFNLTTTNTILMKLTTIYYLHSTFNWGEWTQLEGVRGREQKTSQNEPENEFFGLISWNF